MTSNNTGGGILQAAMCTPFNGNNKRQMQEELWE